MSTLAIASDGSARFRDSSLKSSALAATDMDFATTAKTLGINFAVKNTFLKLEDEDDNPWGLKSLKRRAHSQPKLQGSYGSLRSSSSDRAQNNSLCVCGAIVDASAYFCHQCGTPKCDAGVAQNRKQFDLKAYQENKLGYGKVGNKHHRNPDQSNFQGPDKMVWRQDKLGHAHLHLQDKLDINNNKLGYAENNAEGRMEFGTDEVEAHPGQIQRCYKEDDGTDEAEAFPGQITTLMMCDIPCRMTILQIVDVMNEHGFQGTYDLVYMPSRPGAWRPKPDKPCKNLQNMGYAFVNFKDPAYAVDFGRVFQNFTFPNSLSSKLTYTKPAHAQGFHTHMKMHTKQRGSGCLLTFYNDTPPAL
jgi:hypothetical protein